MSNSIAQTLSNSELRQWYDRATQAALAANIATTEIDLLLQKIAGLDQAALSQNSLTVPINAPSTLLSNLTKIWQQRLNDRVPMEYLLGVAQWRNFCLQVSPDVLIPRPETEGLIDMAIAAVTAAPHLASGYWADLGTGSGAIAIALADAFPDVSIHAVDCEAPALKVAQANATQYGVQQRIQFHQGSWFEPLAMLKGKFSGMIANPPYVPVERAVSMDPEVAHEPQLAVYGGGNDGLDHVRHLIAHAPDYLMSGGIWLLEMMVGQSDVVLGLLEAQGSFCNIQIQADYAGRNRLAIAYRI